MFGSYFLTVFYLIGGFLMVQGSKPLIIVGISSVMYDQISGNGSELGLTLVRVWLCLGCRTFYFIYFSLL